MRDWGRGLLREELAQESFTEFAKEAEPRLRQSLASLLGSEPGKDAAAEAMSYAWANWDRVRAMDNPVGYLYSVGRQRGRRSLGRERPVFYPVPTSTLPWVEPKLPAAMSALPERQRVVVVLVYCFEWTLSEVADLLGLSKSTIQNHNERGLRTLQASLGADR